MVKIGTENNVTVVSIAKPYTVRTGWISLNDVRFVEIQFIYSDERFSVY